MNNITVTISNQPLMDKITQLQQEINTLEETITSLNAQIADLNQQVEQKQATIDSLNLQISQLQEQVSQLDAQVTTLTEQVQTLTLENSQLTQQIGQLQASVQSLNEQITGMINQINTINGETVESPIEYLAQTKSDILAALQNKGSSATSSTTFRNYANIISHFNVLPDGDEHTTLLLHLDSNNQLKDSSIYKRPISTYGAPIIDTTQAGKFGHGCLSLDGNSCLFVNQNDYIPFPAGFTIEFFIKEGAEWTYNGVYTLFYHTTSVSSKSGTTYYPTFGMKRGYAYSTTNITVFFGSGASTPTSLVSTSSQTFTHIALVQNPEDPSWYVRVYVNGSFVNWYGNNPQNVPINGRYYVPVTQPHFPLYLFGRYSISSATCVECCPCYVNELRISDICRYNENFTPPTEPFTI